MSKINYDKNNSKGKPPIFTSQIKTNHYRRSPSTSKIASSSNISSNPPLQKMTTPSFNSRKTGSCQNLLGNSSTSFSPSRKSDDLHPTLPDKYKSYGTQNGNSRSATNNSFGNAINNQSSPNKLSFYNGYSSKGTTSNYQKSGSSGSSSTTSPETSGNTVSNSFSGPVRNYNIKTNSTATTMSHSTSVYNSSSDSCNKYNGTSHTNGGANRSTEFGSINPLPRSETMKSLNNSVNEPPGLVGLANLGNTCYMNSVLQCLSNCKLLQEYCISNRYERDLNHNSKSHGNLIKSYAELMQSMWKSESSFVSPEKFKKNFQKIALSFHGSSQQDSQEFLRIMLEGLHQDVNRANPRARNSKINEEEDEKLSDRKLAEQYWMRYINIDNSFIVELFVGQLKSTLLCRKCGHKSVTFDPFWDLSLPIPKNRRDLSLADCLDLFTSEEMLDGDEMPKCSKCKVKRPCTKKLSIKKFPPILVIHLKRFSGDRYRSKISTFIDFPTKHLNLQPYDADQPSESDTIYNLYGVSNHSGTVFGGHYTAYCCNPISRYWYLYNDTRVQRVDESTVSSPEAYVLFYESIR